MNISEMLKDIAGISQLVNSGKGLTPPQDIVKKRVMEILDLEQGYIFLGSDEENDGLFPVLPLDEENLTESQQADILKLNKWMKNSSGNLVIETRKELEKLDGMQSDWINQVLGIHLVTNGIRFGTAFFINRRGNRGFTDEEICYAQACMDVLANSVENHYLKKALEKKFRKVLRLNKALFIENSKLKTNIEHLDMGIIITDATGHVDYMNQSAKAFFSSLTDTSYRDLFNDPLLYDFNEIIQESIRKRSVIREQISTVNGNLRMVSVIASPIYSSNTGLLGVVLALDEALCAENQEDRRLLA